MDRTLQQTALYGRNGETADPGERKTWMDRFLELEPDGGFRTVDLMWQRKRQITILDPLLSTGVRAPELSRLEAADNTHQQAALYVRNGSKTADPGERKTWMDRFLEVKPEGGFRTVYLTWRRNELNRAGRSPVTTARLG